MKIVANRRDDILKRRSEYDDETAVLEQKADEGSRAYRDALDEKAKSIESAVADLIGPSAINLSIRINPYGTGIYDNNWQVEVTANDAYEVRNSDKVSLRWNWSVTLDNEGNPVKDSGSWSGLKAITPEQIEDLEESVRIIKILNDIDWASVLNVPKPDWNDYYDKEASDALRARKKDRPKFEDELVEAEVEDLIGTNTAIRLTGDEGYRGDVYMLVDGMTDKFLKGAVFPKFYKDGLADDIRKSFGDRRVAKSKIYVRDGEIETIELA